MPGMRRTTQSTRHRDKYVICLGCTPNCFMANCHPCYKERTAMKLSKSNGHKLQANNEELLNTYGNTKLAESPYFPLLVFWAQMLDMAAEGTNAFFIAGTTKDLSAISLTATVGASRESCYAGSLDELAEVVSQWL